MQNVQFPAWLALVLLAAPPLATFLGALIGQWVSSKGASEREEQSWARRRQERLIESRTASYGELLAAARHWLRELNAWGYYLLVEEGFKPPYFEERKEIENRMRQAAASVALTAPKNISIMAGAALRELTAFRDRIDFESTFPENRPQDGTDSTSVVEAVVQLETALRADLEKLLGVELG